MTKHTRIGVVGITLLASICVASAQQAEAPKSNPLDVIPDKMPFNIPYGAPISLARAQAAIGAAMAEADKRGWTLNVAVVDSGGNLVAFGRMDGAQLASISISEHKARAAVTFRRPTRVFEDGDSEVGLQVRAQFRRSHRFARRNSARRGRKAHRRHRLLGRRRLAR